MRDGGRPPLRVNGLPSKSYIVPPPRVPGLPSFSYALGPIPQDRAPRMPAGGGLEELADIMGSRWDESYGRLDAAWSAALKNAASSVTTTGGTPPAAASA